MRTSCFRDAPLKEEVVPHLFLCLHPGGLLSSLFLHSLPVQCTSLLWAPEHQNQPITDWKMQKKLTTRPIASGMVYSNKISPGTLKNSVSFFLLF